MGASSLFRISAVVLLLFAALHTYGFLSFRPPSAEGLAVRDGMDQVHFTISRATLSYGGFYRGFGLICTLNLLLSAFLAWYLGDLAKKKSDAVAPIGWALTLAQLGGVVLCWLYFAAPQVTFSAVVAMCLGWATWKGSQGARATS